jgi:hypothetical protein
MVYTDNIHLIADSIEELHAFAASIGLKKCWFQNKKNKNHPHYDVFGRIPQKAIEHGALLVSSREILKILKEKYR